MFFFVQGEKSQHCTLINIQKKSRLNFHRWISNKNPRPQIKNILNVSHSLTQGCNCFFTKPEQYSFASTILWNTKYLVQVLTHLSLFTVSVLYCILSFYFSVYLNVWWSVCPAVYSIIYLFSYLSIASLLWTVCPCLYISLSQDDLPSQQWLV